MRYILLILLTLFCHTANAQKVYRTPTGKKYHLASCNTVNNVSAVLAVAEAVQLGLEPCKICKPPLLNNAYQQAPQTARGESNTVQCKGLTKARSRCKHMTSIANGYCFQHNPDKH